MTDYETKYRALREAVKALADEWDNGIPCDCGHSLDTHNGYGCYERLSYEPLVKCDCALTDDRHDGQLAATILRALLAPSPAEGTGEAVHDDGCAEWCNHCEVCGTGTPYGSRCPAHPSTPAPVSSGEAGKQVDPDFCAPSTHVRGKVHSWKFDGDDPYIICHFCDEMRDAHTGRVVRPAPVVTPNTEGGEP